MGGGNGQQGGQQQRPQRPQQPQPNVNPGMIQQGGHRGLRALDRLGVRQNEMDFSSEPSYEEVPAAYWQQQRPQSNWSRRPSGEIRQAMEALGHQQATVYDPQSDPNRSGIVGLGSGRRGEVSYSGHPQYDPNRPWRGVHPPVPQQPQTNVTDFIRAGQQAPQQGKGMQRFMNRNIDPRERAAFQSMPIQQQRQARRDLRQERRQGRRDASGKGGGLGSRQPVFTPGVNSGGQQMRGGGPVLRGFAQGGTPWRGDAIAQNRANIAAGITPVGTPWNQNPDLVGGFLGSRLGTPAAPNQVNAFMGGATGWNALPDPVWGGGGSQNPKSGNDAQGQASAPTGIPNFMGSGWAPNVSPWMPSTPPGGYNVDTTQASGNQASGNQASGNQAPAYGTPGAPGYQAPQNMGTLGQQYLDAQSFYDMSNQPFQNTTQFIDQGRNVLQGQAGQDARMQNLGFHGATLPGAGAQYGGVDMNNSGAINMNDFILQGQQALRNR